MNEVVDSVATGIEVTGIAIIVIGALISSLVYIIEISRGGERVSAYHTFRSDLGRGILLGLEFLVAADIIGTVAVDPSFESLGILAIIVAIRTFLSFSLELEISGRWPWQGAAKK